MTGDDIATQAGRDPLRSRLMRSIDGIEKTLRDHADVAETLGTLPEPSWRALHDAGLFLLKAPREAGGIEADPVLQIEVIERLACIDTSAGWTAMIGGLVERPRASRHRQLRHLGLRDFRPRAPHRRHFQASAARRAVLQDGVAGRGSFQHELGRCDMALRAARSALIEANAAAWREVNDTGACDVAAQTELRSAAVYATEVAMEVARCMFRHAGARSLYAGNVVERCVRDVTAAGQHVMVSEVAYERRGQVLLGFPDVAPMD